MGRSGYSDGLDGKELNCWRGAVNAAIRGKRGQAFLREMLAALDAMPEKRLAASALVTPEGECCAMGAVALRRGIDTTSVDAYDRDRVAGLFGIATALAAEISFENDGDFRYWRHDTPEQRWARMREWVARKITAVPVSPERALVQVVSR